MWPSARLGVLAQIRNGAPIEMAPAGELANPVFGSGGVFGSTDEYLYDGPTVLFGRKGTVDRPLYYEGRFWTIDTMFYTIIGPQILPKFLYYWANTIPFGIVATSTAVPSVTAGDLGRLRVPVPRLIEQQRIVDYLDAELSAIAGMEWDLQRLAASLAERRTALVTDALTGRKEIP